MSSVETQLAAAFDAALKQQGTNSMQEQRLEQGMESALPNLLLNLSIIADRPMLYLILTGGGNTHHGQQNNDKKN